MKPERMQQKALLMSMAGVPRDSNAVCANWVRIGSLGFALFPRSLFVSIK